MNTGDRVRILAGRGSGHEGIVAKQNGSSVMVSVPSMSGLTSGQTSISVRRRDLQVIRTAAEDARIPNFRPYRPAPWSVPRAGSDIASRLPSVAGDQLIYPRGLR